MSSVGEVVGIVPAAGRSARMGRDKLLLRWGETVVIGAVVDALKAGGARTVVVVSSQDNVDLQAWVRRSGHTLAINPTPQRGMLSSVGEGLLHLGGAPAVASSAVGLLVCPGDHAGIATATVERLCAALHSGARLAVPVHRRRRGHPLAIGAALIPRIVELDAGIGLRQLVGEEAPGIVEISVDDPAVVRDLDTRRDYEAALAQQVDRHTA